MPSDLLRLLGDPPVFLAAAGPFRAVGSACAFRFLPPPPPPSDFFFFFPALAALAWLGGGWGRGCVWGNLGGSGGLGGAQDGRPGVVWLAGAACPGELRRAPRGGGRGRLLGKGAGGARGRGPFCGGLLGCLGRGGAGRDCPTLLLALLQGLGHLAAGWGPPARYGGIRGRIWRSCFFPKTQRERGRPCGSSAVRAAPQLQEFALGGHGRERPLRESSGPKKWVMF